jgi:cobalamin biosynthesis Mg chelatase CobN
MADVLEVRGIGFEDADDDLLAHEIGHYLTKLQEKFMPHGLHIFGQDWSAESLKLMADSMGQCGRWLRRRHRRQACGLAASGNGWPARRPGWALRGPGQGQRPAALPGGPAHRAQLPRRRWRPPAHPPGLRPRRPPRRAGHRPPTQDARGRRQRCRHPVGLRRGAR